MYSHFMLDNKNRGGADCDSGVKLTTLRGWFGRRPPHPRCGSSRAPIASLLRVWRRSFRVGVGLYDISGFSNTA